MLCLQYGLFSLREESGVYLRATHNRNDQFQIQWNISKNDEKK